MAKILRSVIPTILTLLNLAAGFTSIIYTVEGDYIKAALFIFISLIFDGLDGRLARFLNNTTPFGSELDSLSDVVSFGIAPALLIYFTYFQQLGMAGYVALLFLISSGASRLARFNLLKGLDYFVGLPIPVVGTFLATVVLSNLKINPIQLLVWILILSYLMISKIKYPTFKNIQAVIRSRNTVLFSLFFAVLISISLVVDSNKTLIVPFVYYILAGPVLEMKNQKVQKPAAAKK